MKPNPSAERDKTLLNLQATIEELTKRLESAERLHQVRKLDAVGQLAGGVAHYLNNVLAVIKGYSAILLEQPDLPSGMVEPLRLMASSTDRAASLTRQLLAYSRRLIMRTQRFTLNDLIGNITPMLRLVMGQDVSLQILHKTDAIEIDADLSMIEQIILNLANNARDAMKGHGQFRLSVETVNLEGTETPRNPEARKGRFVCVILADTGPGMSQEGLDHLFEPFYTTKDVGDGTGMGLASVYGMVKQHHGWIEVDSVVGKGTQFNIFLPVPIGVPAPSVSPVPEVSLPPGQKTILVVEDEPDVRQMVAEVLNEEGYRILQAANGVEALEVWRLHQDQIEFLLTDVVMPRGITGVELAQRLKAEQPRLKVLYSTGYGAMESLQHMNLREGINFLIKPYLPAQMLETVAACLEKG
jgi:two-component system cell cycle sensor histidine kinase/response regulator CckA